MVTSIKFADNSRLKECGAGAFAGAESLLSLTLPSSVETIGMEMFKGDKSLMEFSIPSHVKKITGPVYGGSYIMSPKVEDSSKLEYVGNYGLMGITDEYLDLSNCAYVGSRSLSCCDNLKSVTLKQDGMLFMGSKVFAKTPNVKEFVIPRGLKELRTTMVNGDKSAKYSTQPFYESSIETITTEDNSCLEYADVYFSSETLKAVDFSGITSASLTFADFRLKSYTKYIGCPSLETLLLPRVAELNYLPKGVLYKSTGLTKLMIPASIKRLSLKLSDSSITELVSEKGGEGFELVGTLRGATSLKSVDIDVLNVPDECFLNCTALESVNLPMAKTVGKDIFVDHSKKDVNSTLKSLNLPVLETIGNYAFCKLSALEDLSLPKVTTVGVSAFTDCTSLRSFSAPKLTKCGGFSNCISLANLSLDSVTELSADCFRNCSGLKFISIPNCTKIGVSAFDGCTGLNNIVADSVTELSGYCFRNCSGLKFISIPNCTEIGISAFDSCTGLNNIVADSLKLVANRAFRQCVELHSLSFPAVKEIRSYAFDGCNGLGDISIPKCEFLGAKAFAGCTNLHQVIWGTIGDIGDDCFSDCQKLTTMDFTGLYNGSWEDGIGNRCFPASLKVVINRRAKPMRIPQGAFSLMVLSECTLYVPAESVELYKSSGMIWKDFGQILPIE